MVMKIKNLPTATSFTFEGVCATWLPPPWTYLVAQASACDLALYDLLKRMSDNPMVILNHAIAAAMVHGANAGLEMSATPSAISF